MRTVPGLIEENDKLTYDPLGNRLFKVVNGTTVQAFLYDADDRITSYNGSTTAYSYDPNGNVLTDGTNHFGYDWEDKLIASGPIGGAQTASYTYNADGLRVQQVNASGTTNYTLDPDSGFGNVIEERDQNNNFIARYDTTDDGELIDMLRGGGIYFYLQDGLGSTRQVTDNSGSVVNSDNFDGFGNLLPSSSNTIFNSFLFDGQQQDSTGLYYLRARYMDPTRGEFESQDPYQGGNEEPVSLHRYLYASDDPADMEDPGGKDDLGIDVGGDSLGGYEINFNGAISQLQGALYGSWGAPGTPQIPTSWSDPDLTTASQSIIINTSTPASKVFNRLTSWQGCGSPKPSPFVTGIGQTVNWSFPWYNPMSIGQPQFQVKTTHYDPGNYFFCVETLAGHPLDGYRYWRVEQVGPNQLDIITVNVDKPHGGYDSGLMGFLGGSLAQANLWKGMLNAAAKGSTTLYDFSDPTDMRGADPTAASIIDHGVTNSEFGDAWSITGFVL